MSAASKPIALEDLSKAGLIRLIRDFYRFAPTQRALIHILWSEASDDANRLSLAYGEAVDAWFRARRQEKFGASRKELIASMQALEAAETAMKAAERRRDASKRREERLWTQLEKSGDQNV